MKGNSETTKQKILSAAADEFASFGFAGARVDRIAAQAGCNKQLIYAYFGSKQGLMEAVAETHLAAIMDAVPIDVNNLAEYAAKLYDYNCDHPQLVRLVQWFNLEEIDAPGIASLVERALQHKIKIIQDAQQAGVIKSNLPAGELLTLIEAIIDAWKKDVRQGQDMRNEQDIQSHRQSIIEAVNKLIS